MNEPTTLREVINEAYTNSRDHGFHDGEIVGDLPTMAMKLALIHSEVSEALEALRSSHKTYTYYEGGKPEGFLPELADVVIRIADLVGWMDKSDEFIMLLHEKMAYNRSRPYKHGKAF